MTDDIGAGGEQREPDCGPLWRLVSVVVVNWNGAEHLSECLTSLDAQTLRAEMEVLVIDNGSTDESLEVLQEYRDFVRVIRNPVNIGFAAGCNQGIRESKGGFIALLNNDTRVEPNWLEELVRTARQAPNVGGCTSKILSYYDHDLIDN